jgi:hypothetical protein
MDQVIASGTESVLVLDALQRIRNEFLEMPGLRLTAAQAQRLWSLERLMCESLLAALVDTKFLTRTRDGAFVRRAETIVRPT